MAHLVCGRKERERCGGVLDGREEGVAHGTNGICENFQLVRLCDLRDVGIILWYSRAGLGIARAGLG